MNNRRQTATNPVIDSDFPDPDIIRVGDTYYMASTTMHFMPGCDILRSYDLVNWELLTHVYERLEDSPAYRLEGEKELYGKGMWAPTLRWHKEKFYLLFTANDTQKTHLFRADAIEGPWSRLPIEGFYHDSSLFFDDDGRVYIVYGNTQLHLTELRPDLSGPLPGGLNRIIAEDEEGAHLGYEGSHMYKINRKYYVFTCHIPSYGACRRSECCFIADSLEGEFTGSCILDDDMGYHNQGVAQGGVVDTPEGEWYAFLFQDRGALGRAPVIMPMHFEKDIPVLGSHGRVPSVFSGTVSHRPDHSCAPLNGDDAFFYTPDESGRVLLRRFWQFNHVPDDSLWSVTERPGAYRIRTGKLCKTLMQAQNTLTQRMTGPSCAAEVTVDGSGMKNGDHAGLCAFQGCYGLIALRRENDAYELVMQGKPAKDPSIFGDFEYDHPPVEYAHVRIDKPLVRLRLEADFEDRRDEAVFYYEENESWRQLGTVQKLYFKMDHFTGCRFGLFLYAKKETGGWADFMDFRYFPSKK